MSESENKKQNKPTENVLDNNDLSHEVYTDANGKRYSKIGILGGIINFSQFKSSDNDELLIGGYVAPSGIFDINRALTWAAKNIQPKSVGSCAKYVRMMMEAGGLNTDGRPVSAYQYVNFLPQKGFKHIASLNTKQEQASWSASSAKPGDIAVMSHGKHGHICMWSGKKWLSDFAQNNMWPYSGDGKVNIFRFNG